MIGSQRRLRPPGVQERIRSHQAGARNCQTRGRRRNKECSWEAKNGTTRHTATFSTSRGFCLVFRGRRRLSWGGLCANRTYPTGELSPKGERWALKPGELSNDRYHRSRREKRMRPQQRQQQQLASSESNTQVSSVRYLLIVPRVVEIRSRGILVRRREVDGAWNAARRVEACDFFRAVPK